MANVLIMGAGPTGLFAAAELARRGVPVRIVERDLLPHQQVRASSIQARTIEILEAIGIHWPVLERSVLVAGSAGFDQTLTELYRMSFSVADTSYQHITILPQWETESLLANHCEQLGVTIERGITATLREVTDHDALVRLEHADGRVEQVRPEYLLDATGAHSKARRVMHEHLDGETYRGTFAVADCQLDTPLPRDSFALITGSGFLLMLIPLPDNRWLVTVELDDGVTELPDEEIAHLIADRSGGTTHLVDVGWRSVFHSHHRMAEHLGDGRHFLLGDAGHLSSPFGGEGLNAGLHDAFDVAWKLDLVLRGRARADLLNTYTIERTIADGHVVQVSDMAHHASLALARNPANSPTRADDMNIAASVSSRFMLDIDYSPSPLVLADSQSAAAPLPGHRFRDWAEFGSTDHLLLVFGSVNSPEQLEAFARRWAGVVEVRTQHPVAPSQVGIDDAGLLLLRPDGHVAARLHNTTEHDFTVLNEHLEKFFIPL